MKRPASPREEDRALIGLDNELGSDLIEVPFESGNRLLADWDDTILPALALPDGQHTPGEIEIVEP
jgi:hypothetical protein